MGDSTIIPSALPPVVAMHFMFRVFAFHNLRTYITYGIKRDSK